MTSPTQHLRLRRIEAGVYHTADDRYGIVRLEHEYDDEETGRRRRVFLWEIIERGRWGWEVGGIGYPTSTLRESRQLLAEHLCQ